MDKQEFIQEELSRLLRDWFVKASLFGAGVFLLFSPLDYVSVPELFATFLIYRIVTAAVLVGLALAARSFHTRVSLEILAFLAVFFSAAVVEVMILQFLGHRSPYYAGMILLAVVALGFLPAGLRFHALLATTIYLVYLVPILALHEIHDTRTFLTQNYFLLFILGAGLFIRHVNTSHLIDKIGLNHEIMEHQRNLEIIVEERTAKLIQASDEWRVTFDSTEDMIMLVDGEGAIIKANKALGAFSGTDIRDLVGTSCFELCSQGSLPVDRHPLTRMSATGKREQTEFYSTVRDRWFFVSAEPLRAGHLRKKGAVLIMRDISGIKILEQGLLEAKEEWEETFNIIEDGISIHDLDHNVIQANAATRKLLRIGDGPLEGRKCYELLHGTNAPISGCPGCEACRTGSGTTIDFFEPAHNRYFEVTALPRPDRNGRGLGVIHVIRDITERKEAVDEIDRAYRRMETILEMAPFGVFTVNEAGLIEYANSAIQSISGMPGMTFAGTRVGELPGCRNIGLSDRIASAFGGQPFRLGPVEFQCRGEGRKSVGHFTGIPVEESGKKKVIVFINDVTELKRAEEERARLHAMILETQKMETIGTLAGGIAHDFNNILTVIMNYSSLLLMKLPQDSPVRTYVSTVLESGERAAGLTRQLLDFSRRQPLQRKPVDLNAIVENHARMLRRIIDEDINLELLLHRPLKNITADSGKIEQVLLNLAVNAAAAMPRGGTLTIETTPAVIDNSAGEEARAVAPGHYARLCVRDTGEGMSPEVRRRIFEPFYTTKKAGEGTGLGLATVYGIIKQHRGFIDVKSREGTGTEFAVILPVTLEDVVVEAPAPAKLPRGTETILVVDDDEIILASSAEILSSLGYTVLTALSGERALEIIDSHRGTVDLLLSDLIMERMDGRQLAGAVAARRPDIKILFMSGYALPKLEKRGLVDLPARIIYKPVKIEALSMGVRVALDS